MRQLDLVIHNTTGLHARPARVFVDIAKRYESSIRVRHGEKHVNAKSLIAVLTLGVAHGQRIQVDVTGNDEELAAEAIVAAVREGLGEGPETPVVAPKPAATYTAAVPETGAIIHGVPGAPGIAIGPLFRFERAAVEINSRFAGAEQERMQLETAIAAAREQIVGLRNQVLQHADPAEAAIFDVHCDLLADPDLLETVHTAIAGGTSAAVAWQYSVEQQARAVGSLSDALLAERATDLRDVGNRVQRLLAGGTTAEPTLPETPVVIAAYDLTPSETASFDPQRVLGFCTSVGGPNAHTAILARALGLPAIVGAGPRVLEIEPGTPVILDGSAGTLDTAPDAQRTEAATRYLQAQRARSAEAASAASEPAITIDGHRIEVAANIGGLDDAKKAAASGAEGVGLLRTEFLFLERATAPTEDEQYQVYRAIAEAMRGQPVIIRTLDIGGDKPLPYLSLPAEMNPFLGERGIRLCLAHPDLLHQQLRAILRAAPYGQLRIMFPMIADIDEVRQTRAVLDALRHELAAPSVEIGIMVEIPSAALMADVLADEVDFFSIGTNDLTQYTLAMDRTHPALAAKADGLHPAVLRLIARTVEAAHAAGKWVGVCGELGGDPVAVPILLGLGVDELSISVPAIPLVKAQIRALSFAECQRQAQRALGCATAVQVRSAG